MTLPGFTAEVSLDKKEESYRLTSRTSAETGKVLPQGYVITPGGDLVYCYNEGGFSGCFTVHHGGAIRYQ